MSIWICLLIPFIGSFVLLRWYKHTLAWWEVIVPAIVCFLFILIFKFSVEKIQVNDTEFHGALVTGARYYEYWETYVHKTCTRTISNGKTSHTVTYDCSYCDKNPPRWTVVNSLGEEFSISKSYYQYLTKLWKASPQFVELDRSINHGGWGCGKDGDMYKINWDFNPIHSKSTTTSHWYENRVQAAHSAFDFANVTPDDVKRYKLFEYPKVNEWKQETVLGLDSLVQLNPINVNFFKQKFSHLNGKLGPKKKVRIFFLFFKNQPPLAASMQEAYWDGGNDNELVVCVGMNSKNAQIEWVRPFTWSPSRRIIPEVREEIMKIGKFKPLEISEAVENSVVEHYVRKDFKEFSYLSVDPPTWTIWVTALITSLITILVSRWATLNEAGPGGNLSDFFTRRWSR